MKKLTTKSLLVSIALLVAIPFLTNNFAAAQTQEFSEEHLEKIRQNCGTAQSSMQRVRQSDIATRINFGRAYDSLVTQLMTPLNTRALTDQSSSAPKLAEHTTALTLKIESFRDDYVEYVDVLNKAIAMKCQERPADFYRAVREAQKLRKRLAEDVQDLKKISSEYRKTVEGALKTFPQSDSNGAEE